MLTYLPAAIALWLAFNLFVVLLLGSDAARRPPND
jgi:hypothetical protein